MMATSHKNSNKPNTKNTKTTKTVAIRDAYDLVANLPHDMQRIVAEYLFDVTLLPCGHKKGYVAPHWYPPSIERTAT